MERDIKYIDIKNDIKGNPRVIVDFTAFVTKEEKEKNRMNVFEMYELAKNRANKIGGKVYRSKEMTNFFVFQCYSKKELTKNINRIINEYKEYPTITLNDIQTNKH